MDRFDVIVIGAGMAGMNAAHRAVQAGATVAIVERDRVGGTCPVRGCIPTKALVRSAEVARLARRAGEFGIRVPTVEVDAAAVMSRVRGIIDRGSEGARAWLESLDGLELISGEATLSGPGAVSVAGRHISAPHIILATGARPGIPPIPGLDTTPHLTSDDVLLLDALPAHLAIIGAGPIALELGQALGRLGCRVTLVEIAERFLDGAEPALAEELLDHLREEGLSIHIGASIDEVIAENGDRAVRLRCRDADGRSLDVVADAVLVAAGRVPDLSALAAGGTIDADRRGVTVDGHLRTSAEGIWAAGDVLGADWGQFTHTARLHGQYVAQAALGLAERPLERDIGPRAIFTDPEFVTVGLTEAQARGAGHQVTVGQARFAGGKARAWGEEIGLVKVIGDASTGEILGAHILAYHGADLIHPIVLAMATGAVGARELAHAFHVHPTLGETVAAAVDRAQAQPAA